MFNVCMSWPVNEIENRESVHRSALYYLYVFSAKNLTRSRQVILSLLVDEIQQ